MNIEEIKKKAPEGATHYTIYMDEVFYLKHINGKLYKQIKYTSSAFFLDTELSEIKPL